MTWALLNRSGILWILVWLLLLQEPPVFLWAAGYQEIYEYAPHAYKKDQSTLGIPSHSPEPTEISVAHSRANEVRSLMAEFLISKMERLNDLSLKGEEAGMKTLLGAFCIEGEDIDRCKERFILLYTPVVFKLRHGIQEGLDNITQLRCTERNAEGTCLGQSGPGLSVVSSPLPAKQFLPYLPTYQDLKEYSKIHRKNKLDAHAYQEWIKSLENEDKINWIKNNIGVEPIQDDFVMTREVLKSDESGRKETIIDKDPQGKIKYDLKAFQAAHQQWEADKDAISEAIGVMKKRQLSTSEIQAMNSCFVQSDPSQQKKDTDYSIYAKVRGPLVDGANQQVAEHGSKPRVQSSATPVKKNSNSKSDFDQMTQINPNEISEKNPEKNYDGKEQVDQFRLKSGQQTQHSIIYSPESFSVERVIQTHIRGGGETSFEPRPNPKPSEK